MFHVTSNETRKRFFLNEMFRKMWIPLNLFTNKPLRVRHIVMRMHLVL